MGQNRFFLWRITICSFILFCGMVIGCSPNYRETEPIPSEAIPQEIKILFVGNSYTFANDFPKIFAHLAQEGGYSLQVAVQAAGGWTLGRHAESNETLAKIRQTAWDYVILQEQSVIPSNPTERTQSMYPAVRLLHAEIDQIGGETLLFMTWGRRDGLPEGGYPRYDEMQKEIATGYLEIANELDVVVAPVGVAWQRAKAQNEGLDLWQSDGSHPSLAGSYLAACVFYATIFLESPEGLAYMAGLDTKVGNHIQSIATESVLEDFPQWNIK